MRKVPVAAIMLTLIVMLSAVVASSASAHEWLTLSGEKITESSATIDGALLFDLEKIPVITGGGEVLLTCQGTRDATVGPGAAGTITAVLGVKAELGTKASPVKCLVEESTNTVCKTNAVANLSVARMAWATELVTVGTAFYMNIFNKSGAELPLYEIECVGIKVTCEGKDRAKWVKNAATGVEFALLGELKLKCTIGEGFVSGKDLVLGFQAV